MTTKPITRQQLIAAMAEWREFFGLPRGLSADAPPAAKSRWADTYLKAINGDRLIRRYWDKVSDRVLTSCRWFPMPADLSEVAKAIGIERQP